ELVSKRLALFHELVPKAVRIAVLVNPSNATSTETTRKELPEAARVLGLEHSFFNAGSICEIDDAFGAFMREHADALFVGNNAFFSSRRGQFATLAARDRLPTCFPARNYVEAGGLMSYGPDTTEIFHQVGSYAGSILKGAKPGDLPVV